MPATLVRPFGAALNVAAFASCVNLTARFGTFEAPCGWLHVASKAASRWRVAEAPHPKRVGGCWSLHRADTLAWPCLTGGQTCHSIAAICLTGGFLNDSTSFDCPTRASLCASVHHALLA